MQSSRTVIEGGSDRASPFLFMPFPFSRRISSVSFRRMRQKPRCIPRRPFNHPFTHMTVNHKTAFSEQRPIHPRTAAQAYIVPSVHPLHRKYHVMTEGGVQCPAYEFIRNCSKRTAIRDSMVSSSCHNSITASHTQLFFLMRSYDHGGD